MGLSEKSIVSNFNELKQQVKWLLDTYNRNVLVEEYVEGQDISMIYIEGKGALGPCIVKCDSLFYDYEMKTTKDHEVEITPSDTDYRDLKKVVENIAKRLDIKGYAKMDFRVKDKKCYLIEVNAQVSFHPMGEFITSAKKDGYEFEEIINYIVENALEYENKPNSMGINVMEE